MAPGKCDILQWTARFTVNFERIPCTSCGSNHSENVLGGFSLFCENCGDENTGRDLKMLAFLSGIPEDVAIFCEFGLFLNSKDSFDERIVLNVISCCMVLCPGVEL